MNQGNAANIQNNIFNSSSAQIFASSVLAGAVIDNNCYNEFVAMVSYNSVIYDTVAAFHAVYPAYETSGAGGTVELTNPATGDFTLLSGSVCKTLGNAAVGVTTDYSGYPFANQPSSGAYQYH